MTSREKSNRKFSTMSGVFLLGVLLSAILCINSVVVKSPRILGFHAIQEDSQGKILSWVTPQETAYDLVMDVAWDFIKNKAPVESCGYKGYIISCSFDIFYNPGHATNNLLDMAGLFGEFVESLVPYYAYTGDRSYVGVVREMLDHALINGLTPSTWTWPNMPYAWSPGGQWVYSGRIEPDKAGEFGLGLLKFYQLTNDTKYLNASLDIADVLAATVRDGNATHAPWPCRVMPEHGEVLQEYTGNVVGELNFLDTLIALNLGNVAGYSQARDRARSFLLTHVVPNNDWRYYFEDYADDEPTKSEFNADETARYLMNHRDWDTDWNTHVQSIWKWVEEVLGEHAWDAYGVLPISEQTADIYVGEFSHTARHASVKAQYAAITGNAQVKDEAFRLFNWATYAVDPVTGFIIFSANNLDNTEIWYTDGYADFVRHFMAGMAAFPEWAPPAENHLVNATAVVSNITYASSYINYTTFNAPDPTIEVFRVNFTPSLVTAGATTLSLRTDLQVPGYTLTALPNGDYILKIQHTGEKQVTIFK